MDPITIFYLRTERTAMNSLVLFLPVPQRRIGLRHALSSHRTAPELPPNSVSPDTPVRVIASEFRLTRHSRSGNFAPRSFLVVFRRQNRTCTVFALDRFSNASCLSPWRKVRQFRVRQNSGWTFPFA